MPPDPQVSTTGIATIVGIAAIGNPRNIPHTRKIMLDTQIYIGSDNCVSILGALAYFNASNTMFEANSVRLFLIYATIAKYESNAELFAEYALSAPAKYDFIGDIQWMVPLTSPTLPMLSLQENDTEIESSQHDQDFDSSDFAIDPSQQVYVHISGLASNCQKARGTFEVHIDHYISSLKSDDNKKGTSKYGHVVFNCYIRDSPRYKQGKPVPYDKRYVSVSGFLVDVVYVRPGEDNIKSFNLQVENIVFMGQQGGSNSSLTNTLDSPGKTPLRQTKGLINYSRKGPVASPSGLPGSSTATSGSMLAEPEINPGLMTPSPAQGTSAARKRSRTVAEERDE